MLIKRCSLCAGRKMVVGFGGIEKKCAQCAGSGYEENIEDAIYEEIIVNEIKDSKPNKSCKHKNIPTKPDPDQMHLFDQATQNIASPTPIVDSIFTRSKLKKDQDQEQNNAD